MDIFIEIGNPEEQNLIYQELFPLTQAFENQTPGIVHSIYIPENFDKTVNDLQKTELYSSVRGHHTALAKTIPRKEGISIVLSPSLYTVNYDVLIRINTILHEYFHALNPNFGRKYNSWDPATNLYLTNLYSWFDEYQAVRASYESSFSMGGKLSCKFLRHTCYSFHSHSNSLKDKSLFYDKINNEISIALNNRAIATFLSASEKYILECSLDYFYTFAIMDAVPQFKKHQTKLNSSPFVNRRTLKLLDFYREKYLSKEYDDLDDGIVDIKEFMKQFGVFFYMDNGSFMVHIENF